MLIGFDLCMFMGNGEIAPQNCPLASLRPPPLDAMLGSDPKLYHSTQGKYIN